LVFVRSVLAISLTSSQTTIVVVWRSGSYCREDSSHRSASSVRYFLSWLFGSDDQSISPAAG